MRCPHGIHSTPPLRGGALAGLGGGLVLVRQPVPHVVGEHLVPAVPTTRVVVARRRQEDVLTFAGVEEGGAGGASQDMVQQRCAHLVVHRRPQHERAQLGRKGVQHLAHEVVRQCLVMRCQRSDGRSHVGRAAQGQCCHPDPRGPPGDLCVQQADRAGIDVEPAAREQLAGLLDREREVPLAEHLQATLHGEPPYRWRVRARDQRYQQRARRPPQDELQQRCRVGRVGDVLHVVDHQEHPLLGLVRAGQGVQQAVSEPLRVQESRRWSQTFQGDGRGSGRGPPQRRQDVARELPPIAVQRVQPDPGVPLRPVLEPRADQQRLPVPSARGEQDDAPRVDARVQTLLQCGPADEVLGQGGRTEPSRRATGGRGAR